MKHPNIGVRKYLKTKSEIVNISISKGVEVEHEKIGRYTAYYTPKEFTPGLEFVGYVTHDILRQLDYKSMKSYVFARKKN